MPEAVTTFASDREASWADLGSLVERANGRTDRLGPDEVRRLGLRYREAAADLAQARRRYPAEPITAQIERLVGQARPLVYGTITERESLGHFVTTGYWRRVRERPVFLLVAAAALLVPTLVMGVWAHANPVEAGRVAKVSPLSAGLSEHGPRDPDTQKVTDLGVNSATSSQIFTNNARVVLVAYAGGLSGGVLTLVSLVFNGLILGLVAGYAIQIGAGDSVWRLIIPHGILELSLITVGGAAGLRTGWALLHPGHRSRIDALRVDGRAGVEMAIGTAVLLVPCGLVEGFLTPRGLSVPTALTVGFGLGGLYWATVIWRGRPERSSDPGDRLQAKVRTDAR